MLWDLLDRELLTRCQGGWALDAGALTIPDSIQGVLAARIDLLDPPAKDALLAGAVIGRSFSTAGLAALVGSAAEVRTLVEAGFVRPTEPEPVFKHALTRDVAYDCLPRAERARRHAAYADWLEGEDASDGRASTLAYHYMEAVDPEIADLAWRDRDQDAARLRASALRWCAGPTSSALARFDLDDALGLLERAAELTPGDPELWHSIARVNALKFDGTAFWESMQKTLELTADQSERGELYAELSFESTMRGAMWKVAPDWAIVSGWIEQALEHAPPDSLAYGYGLVGKSMLEDDIPAAERAIAIAERLDDAELLSFGLSAHSANAQSIADFATAAELDSAAASGSSRGSTIRTTSR